MTGTRSKLQSKLQSKLYPIRHLILVSHRDLTAEPSRYPVHRALKRWQTCLATKEGVHSVFPKACDVTLVFGGRVEALLSALASVALTVLILLSTQSQALEQRSSKSAVLFPFHERFQTSWICVYKEGTGLLHKMRGE